MVKWERIVIHHTATPDGEVLLDTEAIRHYHITERGWSDIGYHWVVERVAGERYIWSAVMGRPMYRTGAHVGGRNTGSIGIALVGDFMTMEPTPRQMIVAAELCTALCSSLGIRSNAIYGHAEFRQTSCPGRISIEFLREYVRMNRR